MRLRSYLKRPDPRRSVARARATGAGPWAVPDLCAAYAWPTGLAGGGVIAIVELGGSWSASDVSAYFASIGQPVPSITDVQVDRGPDAPGGDADGEVALDIQVAAAAYYAATGTPATIRVYWATDIAPAIEAATKDGCDVCTISWGSDEANWGAAAANALEAAAIAATAAGMVVLAASGDNDSSDGGPTPANVDLPAGCPHVIGCGGTNKTRSSETVWNDAPGSATGDGTGGGYSTLFPMPAWQTSGGAPAGPGKLVPDVAAVADPNTGYEIIVGGQAQVVGGTSAVAPLYAGLLAAMGKRLGFLAPTFWGHESAFADITQGDNGQYHAAIGPDPCTGIGVPIGRSIAALLVASSSAGAGVGASSNTGSEPIPTPSDQVAGAAPPAPTLEQVISWAEARLPKNGFVSPGTVRSLIQQGLTANYPKRP